MPPESAFVRSGIKAKRKDDGGFALSPQTSVSVEQACTSVRSLARTVRRRRWAQAFVLSLQALPDLLPVSFDQRVIRPR